MSQAFDLARDHHRISRDEASGLIRAHQAQATPGTHQAGTFNCSAFKQFLAQPGAAGIRIYHTRHTDDSPMMVRVAVSAGRQDLASPDATVIQNGANCPPICATTLRY